MQEGVFLYEILTSVASFLITRFVWVMAGFCHGWNAAMAEKPLPPFLQPSVYET